MQKKKNQHTYELTIHMIIWIDNPYDYTIQIDEDFFLLICMSFFFLLAYQYEFFLWIANPYMTHKKNFNFFLKI